MRYSPPILNYFVMKESSFTFFIFSFSLVHECMCTGWEYLCFSPRKGRAACYTCAPLTFSSSCICLTPAKLEGQNLQQVKCFTYGYLIYWLLRGNCLWPFLPHLKITGIVLLAYYMKKRIQCWFVIQFSHLNIYIHHNVDITMDITVDKEDLISPGNHFEAFAWENKPNQTKLHY